MRVRSGPFVALLASLLAGLAVLTVRQFGALESLELAAYDRLLRAQPGEPPDERLLIVEIGEAELGRYRYPLPDDVLASALARLLAANPRVVGIDIYRDRPSARLARQLADPRVVGVARVNAAGNAFETAPPPGLFEEGRIGFSDLPLDDDQVIRQHFLYSTLTQKGQEPQEVYAFPVLLALNYLQLQPKDLQVLPTGEFQVRSVVFPRLQPDFVGYRNHPDYAQVSRSLIRFRGSTPAPSVTMADLLAGRVAPARIRDRAILVGYTAESTNDVFAVPYQVLKVPGVVLHAQVLSQFLAAVLDHRPLIWGWVEPLAWLWTLGWALAAGLVTWALHRPLLAGVVALVGVASLVAACFVISLQAGWVPLVPPALALVLASLATAIFSGSEDAPAPAELPSNLASLATEVGTSGRASTVVASPTGAPPRNPFQRRDWSGEAIGTGGRYQINRRLGGGGMGEVYLALDRTIGRDVALKILKANVNADAFNLEKRFEKEARVCAALRSEHIVQVSDYGVTEEGFPFYVMEFLQGESLGQLLRSEGRLSVNRTLAIIRQVCAGLQLAHNGVQLMVSGGQTRELVRVVHRDLKPDNIFLIPTASGELVKVVDFGIAKTMSEGEGAGDRTDLTMGGFIGTSRYAAPEQWRGERNLDHRADIYSLGIILYEMLSGNNPFGIDSEEAATAPALWYEGHVLRDALPLRSQPGCADLPPALEAVVMRCLVKQPDRRFTDVAELAAALEAAGASA